MYFSLLDFSLILYSLISCILCIACVFRPQLPELLRDCLLHDPCIATHLMHPGVLASALKSPI